MFSGEEKTSWFEVESKDESVYFPLTDFPPQVLCSWHLTTPVRRTFEKQRSFRALLTQPLYRACWYWCLKSTLWYGHDVVWSSTGTVLDSDRSLPQHRDTLQLLLSCISCESVTEKENASSPCPIAWVSSLPELLALTFRDSRLGSLLVPYHLALHHLMGELSIPLWSK